MASLGNAIAAALGGWAEGSMLKEDREFQRQRRSQQLEADDMALERARALRAAEREIVGRDYMRPEITRTYQAPDLTSMSEIPPMVERTVQVRPAGVDNAARLRDAARLSRLSGDYRGAIELDLQAEQHPFEEARANLGRARQLLDMGNPAGALPFLRSAYNQFPDGETLVDLQFDPGTGRYFAQTIDEDTGEPLGVTSFSIGEAGELLTRLSDPKAWFEQQKLRYEMFKDDRAHGLKEREQGTRERRLDFDVWRETEQLGINRGHLNIARQRANTEAAKAADQINDLDIAVTDLGTHKVFYSKKTGQQVGSAEIGVSPDVLARIAADERVKTKDDFGKAIQTEIAVQGATRSLRFAENDMVGMDPNKLPTDEDMRAQWRSAMQDATTHQTMVMINRDNPNVTLGSLAGPAYVYAAWKDPTRRGEVHQLARQYGLRVRPDGSFFEEVPQRDGTILRRAITASGQPVALDVVRPAPARGAMELPMTDPVFPLTGSPLQVQVPRPPRGPAIDLTSQIPR